MEKENSCKISVIIPVYNAERYLKECLQSIFNQTIINDIEVIIVNDGSTDNSSEIITEFEKEYSEKFNIKTIEQKNQGVLQTRINGYKIATGEYVGWIDADDFIEKNMYEELYKKIKNTDADVAICNYSFYPKIITHKKKWYNEFKGCVDYDFVNDNTVFWNKIVKKSLLDKINITNLLDEIGEAAYTMVLINTNKIVTINEELYNYRVGHQSFSTNYKNVKWFEENIERSKRKRKILSNDLELEKKWKDFFDYTIFYYTILMLVVSINANNIGLYKKYKSEIKEKQYKKNKNIMQLLKRYMGFFKRGIILNIICNSYYLSIPIVKVVLKIK